MQITATAVRDYLVDAGIPCGDAQASLLSQHLDLVFEANRSFNLTRITPKDALALHVLDSLAALPELLACPAGAFVDIGAGAGFPGIPLHVLSGREGALVESVKKKAAFLSDAVQALCLNLSVHAVRAEELALAAPFAYSAVVARALTSMPALVELAAPLLARGGRLVALKGRPESEELSRGDAAARICGLARISTRELVLPGTDAMRTIVVYERSGNASTRLPRRSGMAQRYPLA